MWSSKVWWWFRASRVEFRASGSSESRLTAVAAALVSVRGQVARGSFPGELWSALALPWLAVARRLDRVVGFAVV